VRNQDRGSSSQGPKPFIQPYENEGKRDPVDGCRITYAYRYNTGCGIASIHAYVDPRSPLVISVNERCEDILQCEKGQVKASETELNVTDAGLDVGVGNFESWLHFEPFQRSENQDPHFSLCFFERDKVTYTRGQARQGM